MTGYTIFLTLVGVLAVVVGFTKKNNTLKILGALQILLVFAMIFFKM